MKGELSVSRTTSTASTPVGYNQRLLLLSAKLILTISLQFASRSMVIRLMTGESLVRCRPSTTDITFKFKSTMGG